jgi:hypothetical protein
MPVYTWPTTAANNATADSTINWAEGMAPSAVNDSARAQMAAETLGCPEFYDGGAWWPATGSPVPASFKNLLVVNDATTPTPRWT